MKFKEYYFTEEDNNMSHRLSKVLLKQKEQVEKYEKKKGKHTIVQQDYMGGSKSQENIGTPLTFT
jgi:hypothetical protein